MYTIFLAECLRFVNFAYNCKNFRQTTMTKVAENKPKKRLIISYHNLPVELQEKLKEQYPTGYTEAMMRIDKAPGDFFYAVVLETEDVNYLVKVDVKIDDMEDEEDKDFFDGDDDIKGADEIIDSSDDEDDADSDEMDNL